MSIKKSFTLHAVELPIGPVNGAEISFSQIKSAKLFLEFLLGTKQLGSLPQRNKVS